jgi:hypothetical protein
MSQEIPLARSARSAPCVAPGHGPGALPELGGRRRPAALAGRPADRLHPALHGPHERPLVVGALDHERGRDPEPVPDRRLISALVAGRDAHRVHWRRRAARNPDLRPVDGRRGRHVPGHAPGQESPSDIQWSPDGTGSSSSGFVPERPPDPAGGSTCPGRRRAPAGRARPSSRTASTSGGTARAGCPRGDRTSSWWTPTGGAPSSSPDGDWDHGSGRWMPDGRTVVFQSHGSRMRTGSGGRRTSTPVDVETRQVRQLTETRGPKGNPTPSPDGRTHRLHRLRLDR